MKLLKLISVILFLFPAILQAKPQVYFDYKIFYTPSHQPYVETLLEFSSPSLKYLANKNGNLVSSLEITQIFKFGDSVVYFDKYIVNSPEMLDSTIEDYYDLKRVSLDPGYYDFEIIIKDLNNNTEVSAEQSINIVKFNPLKIGFSTIGFIQSATKTAEKNNFVKNGFFMLPYLTNYFPPIYEKMGTYFEIYNTNKIVGESKKIMLTFEVEDVETGVKVEDIFKVQKFNTAAVIPVLSFLSIDKLATGDYNLVVSVINSNNEIIKVEKLFFQRRSDKIEPSQINFENLDISQSFTNDIDKDSLPFYLNSLLPISPRNESKAILSMLNKEKLDINEIQKYFHAYWVETNPIDAYDSWLKYKKQVLLAEKFYATQIKHGFESDRGRVFLQYGVPNHIQDIKHDHSSVPYQIWHYYRIGKRSNVRFVFYNPDLVTNDYPLLHSDMQGEKHNANWQEYIQSNSSPDRPINPSVTPLDKDKVYDTNSGRYYRN